LSSKETPPLRLDQSDTARFYAPWCGHCKNLKPAWETAAKSLAGIAKVAAMNCDDEKNKPLCGQMGVQGFPTLKIVRPGKKPGKPTVEDYQGPRAAKAIVETVKDKIPNNVKRITDAKLDDWLAENKDSAKAILFSDKTPISATLRTTAIDFAGLVALAQVKKDQAATVAKYGVEKYPTLVLLPAGSDEPIKYEGEMNKDAIVKFLSQVAPPNPDCPDPKAKKAKKDKKDEKKESKSSSKFAKASASHKSSEASSAATSAADETIEEANKPTESSDPNVKTEDTPEPIVIPEEEIKPTIKTLSESAELQHLCLNPKKLTCVLAILPKDETSEAATTVVASLASIHKKYDSQKSHLFPFVGVSASNPLASSLVKELSLGSEDHVHLIATHGKKAWYKKYSGETFGSSEVEQWVDSLRMGEGKKETLPASLISTSTEETEKVAEPEPVKLEEEPEAPSEAPADETAAPEHGEL
jgi:protein disulfide-isomerase A6